MKFEYYCRVDYDLHLIDLLQAEKIKYKSDEIIKRLYFTLFSDNEQSQKILNYIKSFDDTLITKSSIFSKEEMERANWFLLYATHMGIDTSKTDYTYNAKCLYSTAYGMKRYYHLDQVNSFVSKKTPKWKNKYQFCSLETGDRTKIFCSDYAKEAILKAEITGVDFMHVIKGDLLTKTQDVSQLVFTNKLPLKAYTFIGEYTESVCPFCGRINYCFAEPNCDNIRLNTDVIPKGIDAFGSEIVIGGGFGEEPIVISKKFYNLITKELNEKHVLCIPIA